MDSCKGQLFSARLHYPVDVTEICSSLRIPLAVAYRQGVVYIAEYSGGKISYIDLEGKTVYNPEKMTVKELKVVLKDLKLLRGGKKSTKRKDLQKKLSNWIDAKRLEEDKSSDQSRESSLQISDESIQKTQKGTLVIRNRVKEPTALHFNTGDGTLFIADQSTRSVLQARLIFNGIEIRAFPLQSIGCRTQVFGVVVAQNKLYVASSCMENGGIFCYKQTVCNASGVAGDTCTWNELPERVLTNNTDD